MNKVKEELRNVLEDEVRFTNDSERKVFEKIVQKNKRHAKWKIPAVGLGMAAICLALFIFIPKATNEQSANPIFDAFVIDETVDMIVNMYNVWSEHDALLAYTKKDQPSIVMTKYFVYEEGEWVQKYATTQNLEDDVEWVHHDRLYSGRVYGSNVENVMLDEKIVIFIGDKNYWVGLAEQPVAQVKYIRRDDLFPDGVIIRMPSSYTFNKHDLSYVPTATISQLDGTEQMLYKSDNMDRGNHHFTKYPIVIDPTASEFERGEIVRYIDSKGEVVISRIVGLPNETFAIQNGTVIIDHTPLDMELGYAKRGGMNTFEQYEKAREGVAVNLEATKQLFTMNLEAVQLGAGEYMVVPDDWGRGRIEMVPASAIRGKVLGYDPRSMTYEWTTSEIALYEAFKKEYDLDVLIGAEPKTVARLYEYATLFSDYETQYHLLTSKENHVLWTLEEHLQNSINDGVVDPENLINFAKMLWDGEWISTDEGEGYIKMADEDGEWLGFRMVQAENGAWEVAFLPIQ